VDAYGGKLLLIISFASSAVCYTVTATATSIWMLFVSRYACLQGHSASCNSQYICHKNVPMHAASPHAHPAAGSS
jgi:hypothetical protein